MSRRCWTGQATVRQQKCLPGRACTEQQLPFNLWCLVATALGYENIIGIDLDDKKLALAHAQGAKAVFNARAPALPAKQQALTGGIMSSIDFVGSQASASMGIGMLARGRICDLRPVRRRYHPVAADAADTRDYH
jgi:hypothetical protein